MPDRFVLSARLRAWWTSPRAPAQLATALAVLLLVTVVAPALVPHGGSARPDRGSRAALTAASPVHPVHPVHAAQPVLPAHPVRRTTPRSVLAGMTLSERVGQLFLAGSPATVADPVTRDLVGRHRVGGVILTGRSDRGVRATADVVRRLQQARPDGAPPLLVATDQEGGAVQVLSGPGFDEIPSAIGTLGWGPARLRAAARSWGSQLRRAGVAMDLAPVLDTVPGPGAAPGNAPIGHYGRQLGYRPATVAAHGDALLRGFADARVAATAKHFPGLGRVRGNTDTSAGVTDVRTGPGDPYLRPFRVAVRAGVPAVMVSTARYRRLDPAQPAAFSREVVGGLLRRRMGFRGVVVSDDLARARQVAAWTPGSRAVRFVRAGGDLVVAADPGVVPAMSHAVLQQARRHHGFRARVDAAALHVLTLKRRHGLL